MSDTPFPQTPQLPVRFICWIQGYPAIAQQAEVLIAVANRHNLTVLPIWEVDYENQQVLHLVAKREPEGLDWLFFADDGALRFMASPAAAPPDPATERNQAALRALAEWADQYLTHLTPLDANAVNLAVWEKLLERVGNKPEVACYHPLGFNLPLRVNDGGWTFVWCPEVTATYLAPLSISDRTELLEAMYGRLAWWTELDDEGVAPEVREEQLDKRFLALESVPRGWSLANKALLDALDQAAAGG